MDHLQSTPHQGGKYIHAKERQDNHKADVYKQMMYQ